MQHAPSRPSSLVSPSISSKVVSIEIHCILVQLHKVTMHQSDRALTTVKPNVDRCGLSCSSFSSNKAPVTLPSAGGVTSN